MKLFELKLGAGFGALAICLASGQLAAQEAGTVNADETAIPTLSTSTDAQVFEPAYFTQFAPRSALDMLQRIPGFDIRGDDDARGLGQATSNVLVNGKRLSGKSDGTITQVSRISASDVVRIEIVDGATLDVPGLSGQVANLIVEVSKISGQFEWFNQFRPLTNRIYLGDIEASVSGATGNLEYTLSANHDGFRGGAQGLITVVDADGDPVEFQQFRNRSGRDSPKIATNLKWTPGNTIVNFNASYQEATFTSPRTELIDGITSLDRDRFGRYREDYSAYEIGGDVEFALGSGKLKLIGLERAETSDSASNLREIYGNGDPDTGGRFERVSDSGERIGRAEYSWKMGQADWQVSGEAAFNRLDRVAALFDVDATGELVEADFPDNEAGVTEDRYEGLVSYGRPLASNLTLQVIAGAENSTLKQTGRAELSRTFWRPKGSASLAWAPEKGLDISLKVARSVGQLSFGSFLASVDLTEERGNSGNAQLVPEQSWDTDLEIKKSLGKWGSATILLFDRQISDLVEIIPTEDGGQSPGNIDKAWRRGVELDSTIQLDPLGINGGRLDLSVELRKSSVADPLDGVKRPLSSIQHRELSLGYRHDIPKSSFAYGGNVYHSKFGTNYRLTETSIENEGPVFFSLFVEHKDVLGMTVNLTANNILGADVDYSRTVYDGFRDTAPVAFSESGDLKFGRIINLRVSGSF